MFRKLMLAGAAALALATPFAVTSEAEARPRHRPGREHCRTFHVYYRECGCNWRCYGTYDCRESAERVAYRLQRRGFEAYVA
jgi:hypothetical protein